MVKRNKKRSKSRFAGKISENANARKRGSGYGYLNLPKGVDLFIPKEDSKVLMDILPYTVTDNNHPDKNVSKEIAIKGTLWYKRPYKIHRSIGIGKKTVVCPRSFGKKCPICDYRDELIKQGYDENKEGIDLLRPSDRNSYAVIVKKIDDKIQKEKIQIFDFSDYFFQEILEEQGKAADIDKFNIFPDHEEGYSLAVRFAKSDYGPKPTRFDFVDREEQYTDDILEEVPHLDEIYEVLSYDDLKEMFLAVPLVKAEEEEEEKLSRKRSSLSGRRRRPEPDEDEDEEPEEEEDEEEEEPEEEDEEEEEESVRRRSSLSGRRRRPEPDEDEDEEEEEEEDEEEEEEEEEEEKPRRKKTLGKKSTTHTTTKKNKCPRGHRFGLDNDAFDDCDDCPVWNECAEKYDELNEV